MAAKKKKKAETTVDAHGRRVLTAAAKAKRNYCGPVVAEKKPELKPEPEGDDATAN